MLRQSVYLSQELEEVLEVMSLNDSTLWREGTDTRRDTPLNEVSQLVSGPSKLELRSPEENTMSTRAQWKIKAENRDILPQVNVRSLVRSLALVTAGLREQQGTGMPWDHHRASQGSAQRVPR